MAVVNGNRRATLVFFLLLSAALTVNAVLRPHFDWDLLAYAGCAEEWRGDDTLEIHAAAYRALEAEAPPEVAERLRGGSQAEGADGGPEVVEYRKRMASDPDAFAAQLPFYRGRIVFIGLLALAQTLGFGVMHAAFALALVSGLLFAWTLTLWATRLLPPRLALPMALLGVLVAGVPQVMSMGTPDMLAASLMLGGAYLILETSRIEWAVTLLALAVATRVNHALLATALIALSALRTTEDRKFTLFMAPLRVAMLVFLVWLCTAHSGTHDWWTVFHHSFVEYKALPAIDTPPVDWVLAGERVLSSLPMFKAPHALTAMLCGLLALWLGWRARRTESRAAQLALLVTLSIAAGFALFPALWPRLMVAPYGLLWVALLCAWSERRAAHDSAQSAPAA